MWSILKYKIDQKNPTSLEDLRERIQEEWNSLDVKIAKNLVKSIPHRLQLVLNHNGNRINY